MEKLLLGNSNLSRWNLPPVFDFWQVYFQKKNITTTGNEGEAVSLRKAYQDMIKVHGVPDTATLMEMTEDAMDNRVFERRGQAFTVRQSLRLQQISGLTRFAEEIARLSDGRFYKLPSTEHLDNSELLSKWNELYTELGDLSREFESDIQNGVIDDQERARLEAIGERMHRTLEELLALMFRIYCKHTDELRHVPHAKK